MGLKPTLLVLTAEKPEEDMTQVNSVRFSYGDGAKTAEHRESHFLCFMLSGGHQEKRFCLGEVLLSS